METLREQAFAVACKTAALGSAALLSTAVQAASAACDPDHFLVPPGPGSTVLSDDPLGCAEALFIVSRGTLKNSSLGTITVADGGWLRNLGTIDNQGDIVNRGSFANFAGLSSTEGFLAGTVINLGTLTNLSSFENYGAFDNRLIFQNESETVFGQAGPPLRAGRDH